MTRSANDKVSSFGAGGQALLDGARGADAHGLDVLVTEARGGDAGAFDAIVVMRMNATYRLAKAILGTAEEAEDATQEAFLAAWRALPTLRQPERFNAWFQRIVVNTCLMSLRTRSRAIFVDILDHPESGSEDRSLSNVAGVDALQHAIDLLSMSQRTVLALRHHEDRSVAEISAILGIPVGTAKWRLYDARAALERAMEAQE